VVYLVSDREARAPPLASCGIDTPGNRYAGLLRAMLPGKRRGACTKFAGTETEYSVGGRVVEIGIILSPPYSVPLASTPKFGSSDCVADVHRSWNCELEMAFLRARPAHS
jgi:hypothetical protein